MKKVILALVLLCSAVSAFAQPAVRNLGGSINLLSMANGPRTALYAIDSLGTVVFVHRGTSPNGNNLYLDYSKNNGATWLNNQGPAYNYGGINTKVRARFPQGVLYNPAGNTNPDSAVFGFFAPTLYGSNNLFGAYVHGSGFLNAANYASQVDTGIDTSGNQYFYQPQTMNITGQGNILVSDISYNYPVLNGGYNDTIMLSRGGYNAATHSFAYSYTPLQVHVSQDAQQNSSLAAHRIAFAKDGLTGYMVLTAHNDFTIQADSVRYPMVLKTTDGGLTWSSIIHVIGAANDARTSLGLPAGTKVSAGEELAVAVDNQGNPHIFIPMGAKGINPFSMSSVYGKWGLFHVYSNNAGATWTTDLVAQPQTHLGQYGVGTTDPIDEYNRVAATVNPSHNLIAFTWIATDTTASIHQNIAPNFYGVAFDPSTGAYSAVKNFSTGVANADKKVFFATTAPIGFGTTTTVEIPVVYQEVQANLSTLNSTNYHYLDNASFGPADFSAANFSANYTTVCVGDTVTFTDLSTNAPVRWQWNFVGGTPTTDTVQNPKVAYATPGTYAVSLKNFVSNGDSASITRNAYITVVTSPSPIITPSGPTTFCTGNSVILAAPAGYNHYVWSNGDTTQTISVTTSGVYSVQVTTPSGCSGTSAVTTITVNPLPSPTITAGGSTSICPGSTVSLSAPAGFASYLWNTGDTTATISVSTSGSYSVTVTTANGCPGTSSATVITVTTPPTPVLNNTGTTLLCVGDTLTLASTGPAYATYTWSTGATTQTLNVTSAGQYSLFVIDSNGCGGFSDTVTVVLDTVTPLVSVPVPAAFCPGDNITLTAQGTFSSYQWYLNGTAIAGATNTTYTATQGGLYALQVTNLNGCTGTTSLIGVVQYPYADTPVITQQGGQLVANVNNFSGTVQWLLNGTPVTGADSLTFPNPTPGTYTVAYTDSNGCTSTSNPAFVGSVPTTSFSSLLHAYPNPTTGVVSIEVAGNVQINTLQLVAIDGRVLLSQAARQGNRQQINLQAFQAGAYLLRVLSADGAVASLPIMKQ